MGNHFIKKYTWDDILKTIKDKELSYVSGEYNNMCSMCKFFYFRSKSFKGE